MMSAYGTADTMSGPASRPLDGAKQTRPKLMPVYEWTP
jgi:hypothetical protein